MSLWTVSVCHYDHHENDDGDDGYQNHANWNGNGYSESRYRQTCMGGRGGSERWTSGREGGGVGGGPEVGGEGVTGGPVEW